MKKLTGLLIGALACALNADTAGDFDYYILSLSWNAGWCEVEGNAKGAESCEKGQDRAFSMHGLWPQYHDGWPQFCSTHQSNPSRAETGRQAELFGSSGSAWHQWNKHGRCTGLSYQDYYATAQTMFDEFQQPEIFMQITKPLEIAPNVIEDAIIEANPELTGEGIAVICKSGALIEVRVCYDREFEPMACVGNAARDCSYSPEVMPVR